MSGFTLEIEVLEVCSSRRCGELAARSLGARETEEGDEVVAPGEE